MKTVSIVTVHKALAARSTADVAWLATTGGTRAITRANWIEAPRETIERLRNVRYAASLELRSRERLDTAGE